MIRDSLRSLFHKPITVKSFTKSNELVPVSKNFRGKIVFDHLACIGCLLCTRTCPTGAIIVTEEKKVTFNLDMCIFCGQCKEICPKQAIDFSSEFLMAVHDREQLNIT
ncbi:MAG: 4Fe-4S binding protein [Candidatus Bathyarchaeota archaeon]|nr:4Fe-4S binding protein [Candidatus Bathyarchaeum tardum]